MCTQILKLEKLIEFFFYKQDSSVMDYKTLFSQYSKLEINTGLIVPLTKVNKVLFGTTQDFPILPKLTLINT